MNENDLCVPQGWQCPICKRVYSPTTPMCWYCGGESNHATVSTGTSPYTLEWQHQDTVTTAGRKSYYEMR